MPFFFPVSSAGPIRTRLGGPRFVSKDEGRQTAVDFEKSKAYFARMHYKRQSRRDMLAKERIGQKQAQVHLQRQYRAGELPDVQITKVDVINPMKYLCYSDDMMAKNILVEIVTQVIAEETNEERKEQLAAVVLSTKPKEQDRYLAMAILEIGLKIPPQLLANVDPNYIRVMCSTHKLSKYGVLLLEQRSHSDISDEGAVVSKRGKHEGQGTLSLYLSQDVLLMMKLYTDVHDYSLARGLYLQENGKTLSSYALKGLQYESLGKYDQAMQMYKTIKDQDEMWNEAYLKSLEHLCAWSEFDPNVLQTINETKPYQKDFLNRHFEALFCLDKDQSRFKSVEETSLNQMTMNKCIKEDFAHEIGLVFRALDRPDQAMNWHRKALKNLRKEWIDSNSCNGLNWQSTMDLIHQCQRISNAMTKSPPPVSLLMRQVDESQAIHLNDRLIAEWKILRGSITTNSGDSMPLYEKLCQQCHQQNHHFASRRFLRYIENSGSLFYKHQINFTISKCLEDDAGKIAYGKKLNALYRQWMSLEQNESLSAVDKKVSQAKVLKALDLLLKQRTKSSPDLSEILGAEKYAHLQRLSKVTDGLEHLAQYSLQLLYSIQNLSQNERLSMLESSYTLIDSEQYQHSIELVQTTCDLHCQLIVQECPKAIKMFPKIILLMEMARSNADLQESFNSSLETLKAWTLIPWAQQLMSLLHDSTLKAMIYPLVIKLAQQYPQTLWMAYNFLSDEVKTEYLPLRAMLKLPDPVQDFVEALKNVALPEVLLKDFLSKIREKSIDDRKRLWKEFEALHIGKEAPQSNLKRQYFHGKRLSNIQELMRIKSFASEEGKKKLEDACKSSTTSEVYKLVDFAPFFGKTRFDGIEIPGQYGLSYADPSKTNVVSIAGFQTQATVFASLRKPIKISIIGDNGRIFDFMVKSGEDLRQDQRIQQVFRLCNNLCKSDLVNYQVIPIFDSLGIIEFVPRTRTLAATIKKTAAADKKPIPKIRRDLSVQSATDLLKSFGRKMSDDFAEMIRLDHQGATLLRQSFVNLSQSYEGFYHLRSNFMKSHAEVCMIGYVLGIGDRHAQNMLLSLQSGKSVSIDFGYSFDAKFALPIPELAPFRYTPQIQGLTHPFKFQGIFKETMDNFLQQLCRHKEVLLSVLSIFIKEPTLDWIKDSERQKGISSMKEFAQKRIATVKRKLAQDNPAQITLDLVKDMVNPKLLKGLEQLLSVHLVKKEEENDVVNTLIAMATDNEILARSYNGWSPHL